MSNKPEWEPPEPSDMHKALIIIGMTIMALYLLAMIGEMPR
jgi:hypothetical protein